MSSHKVRILILLLTMIGMMRVTLRAQPTISQQPTNQMVALGGTLSLVVTATSDTPISYQWFKDSRLLLGATNSTLTVTNAGVINSGTYYVVLANERGMVISSPKSVAVGTPCLVGWGRNNYGQLGIGTTVNQNTPITVTSNVVAGAVGWGYSLFVTTDGKLWAMGHNAYGQLGNGATINTNLPINVASNVVAVAAGWMHSLFVTADGKLWTVGGNWNGQLGYNTNVLTMNPNTTPICVASNVVTVAAGENHSLFLKSDGTLWGMGENNYGQLGSGDGPSSASNVTFPKCLASNVVAAAGGYCHSLFVTTDGTLWAMGYNFRGQLGNGTTSNTNQPIMVASHVLAVAAGMYHSLFVTTDGTLWAMGYNQYGQLGDGTTNDAHMPISVASNVVAAAAGWGHSLFGNADGTLFSMGLNDYNQLGNASTSNTNLPVYLANILELNVLPATMGSHSLALGISSNAVVTLGNMHQTYTGNMITVTARTTPPGLTVMVTYNGFSTPPTNAGSYTVIGTINDPTYFGSTTNTLVVTPQYIINQPTDQIVWLGGNCMFTLGVSNISDFTYQWLLNSKILTNNIITTVAGKGPSFPSSGSYSGDGIAATNANLNLPQGVKFDSFGNLFFADNSNNRIRVISNTGIIRTVAGKTTGTFSGDGGSATNAGLYAPSDVASDTHGNLFIADTYNNRIRMVNTNGIITTVAGRGPIYPSSGSYSGDGGQATNANMWLPSGIAIDGLGNLFIADSYNCCIRKVSPNGIITTVAGNGTNGYSGDDNIATNAQLSYPSSVAVDATGNLFIGDSGNNRIRKVSTNGTIQTVAGNGIFGYSGDNGPATNATLYNPTGVTLDAAGSMFIADSRNNRIRKVDASGIITTVAGIGSAFYSGEGGVATNACLNQPKAVAIDGSGNIFIADTRNNRIRKAINTQGPFLALYNVSATDAGNYQVIVTAAGGSITSSVANLSVTITPLILRTGFDAKSCIAFNALSKPGSTNVVQRATNLSMPIVWQNLSTNLAGTDGKWNYADTNAVKYESQFYRYYEK